MLQEVKDLTCSACIGAVGSIIFDYETLGLSDSALANILTPLCSIVLDRDVCGGAINNYLVNMYYVIIYVISWVQSNLVLVNV